MPSQAKIDFLNDLRSRFGAIRKVGRSHSLFEIGDGVARVYVRYSKLHHGNETFYGLRDEDLQQLEGRPSVLCFLWPGQENPLLIPFSEYEDVFGSLEACRDGQYKVMTILTDEGTVLYVERAGRFNVDAHFGWSALDSLVESGRAGTVPELSHSQVQTLLGAIGAVKGYDVWVPLNDRDRLDWSLTERFDCSERLPHRFDSVRRVMGQVDVIWIARRHLELRGLFEIEHTTAIYSGLLRLNDVYLAAPLSRSSFAIVARDARRDVFVQQVNRPTFQSSSLSRHCNFHSYVDVYAWFRRIMGS